MVLDALSRPVVQAPLAGGPSTPALAGAVSEAGGLGFVAAGYRTAPEMAADIAATRALTGRPFGVNLFVPASRPADPAVYAAYLERLGREAERHGVELGTPRSDPDDWVPKLAHLMADPPPVVSFTFGCPEAAVVRDLHRAGSEVWITITSSDEARRATAAGADVLVAQGVEAGGHRGTWTDNDDEGGIGLLSLLQLLAPLERPVVAAGGIATAAGVVAVLAVGAQAAQVGTGFMRCPEAGTSELQRAALAGPGPTLLTRAFTGRLARGIANRFAREHSGAAPRAYPEIHHVTAPLRAAGRAAGDPDVVNLWAGQAHTLAPARPAGEVVRSLTPCATSG